MPTLEDELKELTKEMNEISKKEIDLAERVSFFKTC
jgi:hypothetical protein